MVLRLVLGAVYTAMAVGQLASLTGMPAIVGAYGLVHGVAAAVLVVLLIAGELVCGVWFLTRPRSTAITPVWVYTAVSLAWSGLAVQAYARGLPVDNCGCFGNYLTQRLSWFVLLQDALTLVYAAVLVHTARAASARESAGEAEVGRGVPVP
ncbi:MauE/DoxX family redox-associated membrane protein [Streptomyces chiangmaiensis]|uniref:MauE/DoxX family redox-associated membrane protein n=1 Tax=Streptomyces chiangmaiensis TaxID=766497 RepID=A0ABU7FVH7_9ACTN|nr:MauE/DoxX family redox-associated membrane protein [Streptomyces chiangmaiensis]MED7828110.1 MauE/DoxX family redox-associated membrane protein [Streptomyces chiangmaiensis]